MPREDLDAWRALALPDEVRPVSASAAAGARGADLPAARCSSRRSSRDAGLLNLEVESGLAELIALGRVTCDSFGGLRWLLVPASRRRVAG